jgi:AbrB family looped-hinge helix DNA binding protein
MSYLRKVRTDGQRREITTTVSTKGHIILPSSIRQRREWGAGTRLLVEETAEGVLLRPAPAFAATCPEDVFASLPSQGRPKILDEMEAGVKPGAGMLAIDTNLVVRCLAGDHPQESFGHAR